MMARHVWRVGQRSHCAEGQNLWKTTDQLSFEHGELTSVFSLVLFLLSHPDKEDLPLPHRSSLPLTSPALCATSFVTPSSPRLPVCSC